MVEVEYEEDVLWARIYGQYTINDWWSGWGWHCRVWRRIKLVTHLLFTGWFEANAEMVFIDENHIDSIISFLQGIKEKKNEG